MDDLSKENEPKFDKIINKDASFEKTLNTNLTDDSYIEEEIFFGPISSKEEKLIEMWKNRKTEYYSPSSNYKHRKDDTPSHINSPLVKTVTKSKIENYTPATNRKDINRDTYSNTPKSRGITTIVDSSCPSKLFNTPTTTKFTPQNLALKSSYNKAGLSKIPRVTYEHKVFRTPQNTLPKVKMTASKSVQPRSRHRTLNIESPVANYLQNNPPPPLVTTVKPRYKVSPLKLQTETAPENFRKTPLKESNMLSKPEMMTARLPPSVHKQGEGFLVNKENISTKRKVPGDRPPVIVLKHKGRMKFPKDTILKNEMDSPCLMTNNKKEEIIDTEKIGERDTGRESLMEISIYEQHLVRHCKYS
ncbi:hypothetical protein Anas_06452 [Armadillidium nasatum]|uniref:Uncharacterized protein n=1 Tax=Armadillidium nasatum TaxID=96803 RepID=A0A5N5TEG6_9CRUS|nr:hypothetical protein Anas_06452 [Armadillidium nasatum]